MKNLLVLHALDPLRPTGLTRLVRRLCQHLKSLDCELTLAMPVIGSDRDEIRQEWESFAKAMGTLTLAWWDEAEFTSPQRERLVHNLERLHDHRPLDHVLAVGVAQCGFAAAIACQLMDVPLSVFVTYRDALCYHSLQPQEIDTCVNHAERIVTSNPHVLHHVQAFHQVEDRARLIDPRPVRKNIKAEVTAVDKVRDHSEPYLVTTGHLDQFMHLRDLVDRVRAAAATESVAIWRHVGSCCPVTKKRIENLLSSENAPNLVHEVEVVERERYAQIVSNAAVHVIPQGETDTNAAAYESEVWGVKTDYPSSHCFPKLRQRKRTVQFGKQAANLTDLEQLAEDIAS